MIIVFETSNSPYCKFLFFEKVILQMLITDGPYRGSIDQVTMNKRVVPLQRAWMTPYSVDDNVNLPLQRTWMTPYSLDNYVHLPLQRTWMTPYSIHDYVHLPLQRTWMTPYSSRTMTVMHFR